MQTKLSDHAGRLSGHAGPAVPAAQANPNSIQAKPSDHAYDEPLCHARRGHLGQSSYLTGRAHVDLPARSTSPARHVGAEKYGIPRRLWGATIYYLRPCTITIHIHHTIYNLPIPPTT